MIDFQALVGDSVDNVPGVPLVGPKKAQALLEQYGTLDEVLAHADEVSGAKLRENLKTFADQARVSRRLVTLYTDLPLELDLEAARVREPDRETLYRLFTELGFRRFAEQMQPDLFSTGTGATASPGTADSAGPQQPPLSARKWETVDTPQKFASFLSELRKQKSFCFDLETTGLDATQADIVGWAICWEAGKSWYIPVDAPAGDARLDPKMVLAALTGLLEDPQITVVNQNIKYDMLVLRRAGVQRAGHRHRSDGRRLPARCRRAQSRSRTLAAKYLQHRKIPISDLIGNGKQQKKMFEVDVANVAEYAAEDADVAWEAGRTSSATN